MSNGNVRNASIWPVITVVVGIIAIGAVAWDVLLHNQNQSLEHRLQKMDARLVDIETRGKNADAAAALSRRKARAAQRNNAHDDKVPGK
jgi:hypothetical protein